MAIVSPDLKNTLILWDIDGTLLHSAGAGMRALTAALRTVFGIEGSLADIDFAGRTDPWIIRCALRKYGLPDTAEHRDRYLEGYLAALPAELSAPGGRILPGVERILEQAGSRPGVAQALLTGNVERGAKAKLAHHGLWHHFPLGAFADDSEIRNELGPHALRRAHAYWGVEFARDRVWIVGDTPRDIACARAIGARAFAVATGGSSVAELLEHRPDAALPDLSDPDEFWSRLV